MNDASSDDSRRRHTRLLAAIFCQDCGINFVPHAVPAACPRCGKVHADPALDSTCVAGRRERAADADEVDELIGNDLDVYRIEALLGAGAMGRVYLARHRDLHRSCALKILPPRLADSDPAYVARFMNEGRAAAALVHPNIITVHAIGVERGYHFLEMEFIAGQSLQRLLDEDGSQTVERAIALACRIAEGLAAAHAQGILHRDLKPENVLLTHQGVPKIADFGLAKRVLLGTGDGATEIVGTPQFMAPELFQGAPASPASDVYALGAVFYVLLTGRLPFSASNVKDLIREVTQAKLPNPRLWAPKLPLEVAECVHTLLERAPANRPPDALAAAQLLQAVLGQSEDLESLLTQAFTGHPGVTWSRTGDRFRVELRFTTGRRQIVFVEPSDHAAVERLLMISSICARAEPAYFETALRLNSEILHGALAIREIGGESVFVMMDNYPRATVDAEEIRRSVLEVAHRADAVERLLTGADLH